MTKQLKLKHEVRKGHPPDSIVEGIMGIHAGRSVDQVHPPEEAPGVAETTWEFTDDARADAAAEQLKEHGVEIMSEPYQHNPHAPPHLNEQARREAEAVDKSAAQRREQWRKAQQARHTERTDGEKGKADEDGEEQREAGQR
jgi:hypothetical protein